MTDSRNLGDILLPPLLMPTDGLTDAELEALGRELHATYCVAPARAEQVTTHDGLSVRIYPDEEDFTHAFFTAASKHHRGWAKDVIDRLRVERARWIVPVIGGHVEGTACYRVVDYGASRKPPPEKRLYVVRQERYVVWLLPRRDGGWRFKTAYVAGHDDINRYIKRQRKIWER